MKLIPLLLCLLLCGCTPELPEETAAAATAVTEADVPILSPVPQLPSGSHKLKTFSLHQRKVQSVLSAWDSLLVFSGYGSTTITRLSGETLTVAAETVLPFELSSQDPSLRITESFLSFHDPLLQEMVILNPQLQEVSRIALPRQITGSPLLSSDRQVLYYCTDSALMAWNLTTGIHRTVKELSYDGQQLMGLHLEDRVLQCRIRDAEQIHTLFLSADNGQLLFQKEGDVQLLTSGQNYGAILPSGNLELLLFGEAAGEPQMLCPADLSARVSLLPGLETAVTVSQSLADRVTLTAYRLSDGKQLDSLTLSDLQQPKSIVPGSDGSVWILTYDPARDCDTLLRWSLANPPAGSSGYICPYDPGDPAALAGCLAHASRLSEKYGIEIRIGKDAVSLQPWDYRFQPEMLPGILTRELEALEEQLDSLPRVILTATSAHFSSLKLCLVRQISGTPESGSLDTATGIQFFDGSDAYVVITTGRYARQALYHELFHVMETHILSQSTALDQWNQLNPGDFDYHYGHGSNTDFSAYLSGSSRAFIDRYSMGFPKEDRARIWEYAFLEGNRELFHSTILQNKLTRLCISIREAYGLEKSPETLPWEQYLMTPLAYNP